MRQAESVEPLHPRDRGAVEGPTRKSKWIVPKLLVGCYPGDRDKKIARANIDRIVG